MEGSQQVTIPEKEANQLTKALRHHRELIGLGLSVYALVTKTGHRALHVAVDHATGGGKYESYDLYYKADTELTKIVNNAVKKIKLRFKLT